ncbi:hypothetical protein EMIHUDRAFT_254472, partial [Emiliania huxleyi CCMP1516]
AAGSLRVACWKQCGLSAKQLRVTRVLVDAVEVVCVAGHGCAPVTARVSFTHGQTIRDAGAMPVVPELLPPAVPDAAVCRMLLLQPLALLAMGGMALLGGSIAFETAATDAWLFLLGGRGSIWPRVVFAAAAGVALRIALGLPNVGLGGALRWCGLTFLVGFPVLRHCLALRDFLFFTLTSLKITYDKHRIQ